VGPDGRQGGRLAVGRAQGQGRAGPGQAPAHPTAPGRGVFRASSTNEFKRHYKDEWREVAINKPELVAEYLYKFQDEGRFGADPRLLVVYIDEDVSIDKIREIINKTDLNNPVEINFTYKHKNLCEKNYKVPCFVILLHN